MSSSSSSSGTRWRGYRRSSRVPTSLRDVTATSSIRGWRHTRSAASAPVKPDAPATTTRASLTGRRSDRLQGAPDRLPALGDLLVLQGAVIGAKLEPEREALPALADLLPAIHVEDPRRAQQLPTRVEHQLAHPGRRHIVRQRERDVLVEGRE